MDMGQNDETELFEGDDEGIYDPPLEAAKKYFGVKYLFPWQRLVIGNILEAYEDLKSGTISTVIKGFSSNQADSGDITDGFCLGRQIVLLPTGAGKSMCFMVPAVMLEGATLIFYPLLGLMSDQARRMKEAGIDAVILRGGQTEEERNGIFRRIKDGAKIIIANPEVLQNEQLVKRLAQCNISHIAIDEAHCIEWGDSFRPAYLTLGKIIAELGIPLVTAFTATASPSGLERISEVLFEGKAHIVRGESDRPNIHYQVHYAWAKKKAAMMYALKEEKPLIIFCGTRRKSEDMARELVQVMPEDTVKFYHAGLSREEKDSVEKWFFPKKDGVLCCTCAFGMGMDKPDIRTVIHLEPSPTAESYIQEAGRGGRDRQVAKAILLWSLNDSMKYSAFEKNSRQRVLKEFAEAVTCRRQILLDALGGEQAACSGCDVCNARMSRIPLKNLMMAEDKETVLRFIWKHRKCYSESEIISFLQVIFNRKSRKDFTASIWTAEDIKEIISQLFTAGLIRKTGILWKGHLTAVKQAPRINNFLDKHFTLHPQNL